MSAFGKAMQLIMDEKGIRQIDIAEASGELKSYISKVASGYIEAVPFDRACRIIDALGVSLDEFREIERQFEIPENES